MLRRLRVRGTLADAGRHPVRRCPRRAATADLFRDEHPRARRAPV